MRVKTNKIYVFMRKSLHWIKNVKTYDRAKYWTPPCPSKHNKKRVQLQTTVDTNEPNIVLYGNRNVRTSKHGTKIVETYLIGQNGGSKWYLDVWSLILFCNPGIFQFSRVISLISFSNRGMFQLSKVRYLISFCNRGMFQLGRVCSLMQFSRVACSSLIVSGLLYHFCNPGMFQFSNVTWCDNILFGPLYQDVFYL